MSQFGSCSTAVRSDDVDQENPSRQQVKKAEQEQEGNCSRDGNMGEVYTDDAVIMRVKDHFGHIWSPIFGRIYFTQKNLANREMLFMNTIAPGTAAQVWALPNSNDFQHDRGSSFPDIKWRASRVVVLPRRSTQTMEGRGTVTRCKEGFGFCDSPDFEMTLFVPGFAATNNLDSDFYGCQMNELEAKEVHFLAIPNPNFQKKKFRNYFVISVHPFDSAICGSCANSCDDHWLRPPCVAGEVRTPVSRATVSGGSVSTPPTVSCSLNRHEPTREFSHADRLEMTFKYQDNDLFDTRSLEGLFNVPLSDGESDCEDGTVVLMAMDTCGYFWSSRFGLIYFDSSAIDKNGDCDKLLTTGQAVYAEISRPADGHPIVGSKIIGQDYRSSSVIEGSGVFRRGIMSLCGVVFDSNEGRSRARPVWVPAWAVMNGSNSDGVAPPSALFDGGRVHYMAIRYNWSTSSAKRSHTTDGEKTCVISIHKENAHCWTKEQMFSRHWRSSASVDDRPSCSSALPPIRSSGSFLPGDEATQCAPAFPNDEEATYEDESAKSDEAKVYEQLLAVDERRCERDGSIRSVDGQCFAGGGGEQTRWLTDCYFTYVRVNHGFLRSSQYGVVVFDRSRLLRSSGRELCPLSDDIIPGTMAVVEAAILGPNDSLRQNVHCPTWRALSVEVIHPLQWSRDIGEGFGKLTEARMTYGMLTCNSSFQSMFVPGWAGVNNVAPGNMGYQVPHLAGLELHFLSMPNPKRRHGEPFVLSVHPVRECVERTVVSKFGAATGDLGWCRLGESLQQLAYEPFFCSANHWIASQASAQPLAEPCYHSPSATGLDRTKPTETVDLQTLVDDVNKNDDEEGEGEEEVESASQQISSDDDNLMDFSEERWQGTEGLPSLRKARDSLVEAMISWPRELLQTALNDCSELFYWAYFENKPEKTASFAEKNGASLLEQWSKFLELETQQRGTSLN